VIVAVPAPTAVTVNAALVDPAATAIELCTVATAGLLLVSATFAPLAGAAAVRVTVPWVVEPAARVDVLSVTLTTADPPVVGALGDPELEH